MIIIELLIFRSLLIMAEFPQVKLVREINVSYFGKQVCELSLQSKHADVVFLCCNGTVAAHKLILGSIRNNIEHEIATLILSS